MQPPREQSDFLEAFRTLGCDLPTVINGQPSWMLKSAAFEAAKGACLSDFRAIAFACHPDRAGKAHEAIATERFKAASAAKLVVEKSAMEPPKAQTQQARGGATSTGSWSGTARGFNTGPGLDEILRRAQTAARERDARAHEASAAAFRAGPGSQVWESFFGEAVNQARRDHGLGPLPNFDTPTSDADADFMRRAAERMRKENEAREARYDAAQSQARPARPAVFDQPPRGFGVIETVSGPLLVPAALWDTMLDVMKRRDRCKVVRVIEPDGARKDFGRKF